VHATFEKAEMLAAAAVEWSLAQLSYDQRLAPLARGAALGFAYARLLDAALAEPEAAVMGAGAASYFEPQLRGRVARDLEQLIDLLADATGKLANARRLTEATGQHLESGVKNQKHRDWLGQQRAQLERFIGLVRDASATAQELTLGLTFDGARRGALPHAPLLGLSRREQQRTLLADALLLHETFGLSDSEIGAIWWDNPPSRDEAKRQGGKVLARARKVAARARSRVTSRLGAAVA